MSTKPYYRFHFKDTYLNNGYYYINQNDLVALLPTANSTTALPDPDGWADIEVGIARNKKYTGVQRQYIVNLQFVKEAARILRNLFYAGGIYAKCDLYVEELNHTTQQYQPFFTGKIDFTTLVDSMHFVQVDILQNGVIDKIITNEDVEYDIPITGSDVVNVKVPSFYVRGEVRYLTGWPIPAQGSSTSAFTIDAFNYRIYANYVSKEIIQLAASSSTEPISLTSPADNDNIVGQRFLAASGGTTTYPFNHEKNFLLQANVDLKNVLVRSQIGFYIDNQSGADRVYRGRLWLMDSSGTYDASYIYQVESPNIPDGTSLSFPLIFEPPAFDIPSGKKLIMQFGFDGPSGANDHQVAWERDNLIKITFEHRTNDFTATGIRYHRMLQLLLDKMTDNKGALSSDILTNPNYSYSAGFDTRPYNWIVLSGDSIRGLSTSPYAYPTVKTSWKDAYHDMDSKLDIGMYVDGSTVYIKPKKELYNKNSQIFDMGEVTDVDIQPANDYIFKGVKVGYKDQEYDQLNGRDEYNAGQLYLITNETSGEDMDLLSNYIHAPYAIFNTWVNYQLAQKTNSKSDNQVFVIEVQQSAVLGSYPALHLSGTVTGITDTVNTYNLGLTPHHNLLRNGGRIASSVYRNTSSTLKFQKSDRNASLITNFGNGICNESNSPLIGSIGAPYYQPMTFIVKKTVPVNLLSLISANPHGYISFNWRGQTWKMFPTDTKVVPARPKQATVKGIATPDIDLRNLEL